MCLWDGIILSRMQSKTRIVVICLITVIMTCISFAFAFRADAAQYTSADLVIQPNATTIIDNTSSNDESEILSSQDWEALLNASSEESQPVSSETTDVLGSPLNSGISGDSFFIWGCIAVGLGVLGIAFFIYSQFIYKHMKSSSEAAEPAHDEEKPNTVIPKRGDSFKEHISKEKPQERQDVSETSVKKSAAKMDDIDWDKFFEEHKN